MLDNVDNVIKLGVGSIKKVHDEVPVCNRRINIRQEIPDRFQLLEIVMNRQVTNP